MKTKSLLFLPIAVALMFNAVWAASSEVKEVTISANDSLKLSVTQIEAEPGQRIHVVYHNEGSVPKTVMAHNWVLLKPGQDANGYAAAAVSAASEGYEPKALAGEVIASIPPLGPHETGDVTFDAPTVPGRYEFLCSFPAHCAAGMRGELIVK